MALWECKDALNESEQHNGKVETEMMSTMNRVSMRTATPLSNDQLMRIAPSIFAERPWEGMSARYMFIPTIQVVERMRQEGFQPVEAMQSRARIAGKRDFAKHLIRFRDFRNGDAPAMRELGTIYPELILTNAHDGGSAYRLDAGLWRLICTNGMTVCSGEIGQINVRHSGNAADAVIEASYQVVEDFPKVIDSVEQFSRVMLPAPAREAYAAAALSLKYDENEAPIAAEALLKPNRAADADPNLWNTFNTVQEHLIKGGDRAKRSETGRRIKTRGVNGIGENQRINKALWMLTEKMAAIMNG